TLWLSRDGQLFKPCSVACRLAQFVSFVYRPDWRSNRFRSTAEPASLGGTIPWGGSLGSRGERFLIHVAFISSEYPCLQLGWRSDWVSVPWTNPLAGLRRGFDQHRLLFSFRMEDRKSRGVVRGKSDCERR